MLSEAADLKDLRNRVDSIKTASKKEDAKRLLQALYGSDAEPSLPAMLAAEPDFAAQMSCAHPQLQRELTACWKLPLEAALHLLYYRRLKEETEDA